MTKTIHLTPDSLSLLSVWNGYPDGHGGTAYTTPTVDGGAVTLTLPEELRGARFESAHLSYTSAGDGGSLNLRYYLSSVAVTDEDLLRRLTAGETEITLYFSFRAAGGSGGSGRFSAFRSITDIALTLNYVPAGGVSGTLVSSGHELGYSCPAASLAPGEQTVLTLLSDMDGGSVTLHGETYPIVFVNGRAEVTLSVEAEELNARLTPAVLSAVLTAGEETVTFPETETELMLVKTRLSPAVSVEFFDENGHEERFGAFVAEKSALRAVLTISTDTEADSGISVTGRSFTLDGVPVSLTAGEALPGALSAGSHLWTASATDSFGLTGTASGTLTLLPYEEPAVTVFEVQRCSVSYDGEGHEVLAADDGSPDLWLTLSADVSAVAGENAWSADLILSGGETIEITDLLSGEDGGSVRLDRDRTLLTDTQLDITKSYAVTLVIRDAFGEKSFSCADIPSAGGILNIERGGVAVGMRSTGSSAEPLFECAYPAVFRGNVSFPGADGGSCALTMTGTSTGGLTVRGYLGMAFLKGTFRLSTALASGAAGASAGRVNIASLPAELCGQELVFPLILERNSGYLRLKIASDGTVSLENRSGNAVGTNVDITVNAVWML